MTGKPGRFAAIIAAAGSSTRMGQPKALLPFADQTFVVHAASVFCQAGAALVVVTLPEGDAGTRVRQTLLAHFQGESRVVACANDQMERGYSGSLQSGIKHCPAVDTWLMMPVDAPFFTAELVRQLVQTLDESHDAAVPRVAGQWGHPIALSTRLQAKVGNLHDIGGPRHLLESLGTRLGFVEWPDPRVTWNLNTPAAYRDAFAEQIPQE